MTISPTYQKPLDATPSPTKKHDLMKPESECGIKLPTNYHEIILGALFVGLGQMVLFLGAPKFYALLSKDSENISTGPATNDFPIEALRPLTQWLLDNVGAFGASSLVAAAGIGFIFLGWKEFLSDKLD